MSQTEIYADNAATAYVPCFPERGNPSSLHRKGRERKNVLTDARQRIAELIGCQCNEIFFTSGGTESNNWAIRGVAAAQLSKGKTHIITSAIEHPSVLETCRSMESMGFRVTYVPVDQLGIVNPKDVEEAICTDTTLVSIMYVNNEVGTIQPIKKIADVCAYRGVPFHTDAVQAVGGVDIHVNSTGADLVSLSGHKFGAETGIGALYARSGVPLNPLLTGGRQEFGMRAGTENIQAAVDMSYSLADAIGEFEFDYEKVSRMHEYLLKMVLQIPDSRRNGGGATVPGILNFSFDGIDGEALVLDLDAKGIYISSGSACTSGSVAPSHVLKAMGLTDAQAYGSVRVSINHYNTMDQVEVLAREMAESVERLRKLGRY